MIAVVAVAVLVLAIAAAFAGSSNDVKPSDIGSDVTEPTEVVGDVVMPTKVSRPGCEETDMLHPHHDHS